MYIRETFDKRVNKKYLFVSETYRDIENKSKIRNLKNFGLITNNNKNELINLANEYIAKNKEHKDKTLLIDFNENANSNHADFNYGFIILEKIFNTLNIDNFIYKNIKKRSDAFDLNSTIKLLVYSRILNPDSKLETFNGKDGFFGNPFKDIKLDNIYDSLTDLFKVENSLQLHIHKEVSKLYDRKMEMVFYDVTNYFFETDYDDGYDENGKPLGLRYSGVSKENRETPIVQMGLLMDSQGIPIAYKLFQGNTHDQKTLVPILEEFKTTFNLKSITVVADKGLNSGANIDYLIKNNHKFIVSQMVRSKDEKFRTEILKDNYKWTIPGSYKIKEFDWERSYRDQKTGKVIDNHKFRVIAYWSKKFAEREKHKRGDYLEKLKMFSDSPCTLNASNSHGLKRYLKENIIEKKTGEVKKDHQKHISVDWEKYNRDVEMDGYYSIITNDWESTPEQIIEKYKGLSKIEETFRVTKSDLEGRPIYVWTDKHIRGHFLTCFISLIIIRLLQKKLEWKYSVEKIQNALNSANARVLEGDLYINNKISVLSKEICKEFGFDLWNKYFNIEMYKKQFDKLRKKFTYLHNF